MTKKAGAKSLPAVRADGKRYFVALALIAFSIAGLALLSRPHAHVQELLQRQSGVVFGPTIPNSAPPPGEASQGMVWIPGGEFSMGAQDAPDMNHVGMMATMDSRPVHRVYVDGFFMDKTDVTNSAFEKFVKATGYVTVAERKPRAEDFPGRAAREFGSRGSRFLAAGPPGCAR